MTTACRSSRTAYQAAESKDWPHPQLRDEQCPIAALRPKDDAVRVVGAAQDRDYRDRDGRLVRRCFRTSLILRNLDLLFVEVG
jgi:hypothetical protein